MQIIIKATDEIFSIWTNKFKIGEHEFIQYNSLSTAITDADLFIDTCFEEEGPAFLSVTTTLVLVNAVITTSKKMPENFVRYNGWGGFFTQSKMEIAGNEETVKKAIDLLTPLGIETVVAADEVGMISPRVVSMIINEAFFAIHEEVSSKEEINTAMKLGTNYPFGPFEWCDKIGLNNIKMLLAELAKNDLRYTIAPALKIN
ncbi:MAG: 3-hydroxyacyl-CoA dehydrogenase family protein [Sediminibacterium sp.]|jgi:3-hydroxybutyryl-CoA dehydrogenase